MTWKSIDGYEGLYEVSDIGLVRSLKFEKTRILKLIRQRDGYLHVRLHRDGKVEQALVHRLVAMAFIPNPQNLETVNHKDEDKTNNNVSNLDWMSRTDNTAYSRPQFTERQIQMLDKQTDKLLATFTSIAEAERQTGISQGNICQVCKGWRKSAGGYVWKYA